MTTLLAGDESKVVLSDKDYLEFLLKLSADAAANARHAETAQNQCFALYFTALAAVFILRANIQVVSTNPGVGTLVTLWFLLAMIFLNITSYHRGLVAVEERDIAEFYRVMFRQASKIDFRLGHVEEVIYQQTDHPARRPLIANLRVLTTGLSFSLYLFLVTVLLSISFVIK